MILVLRGHIRDSFQDLELLNLVKSIYDINPTNIKIFIHTWSIYSNNISWKGVEVNNEIVTKEKILDYFGEIKHVIEDILIDDDSTIERIGNLEGNVANGPMPIIGWKNYWYGKYRIFNHIYNKFRDRSEMVVNFRFDVLDNSNNFDIQFICNFVMQNIGRQFNKNCFFRDEKEYFGCDNIYIGNIFTMYNLAYMFFYHMDDILPQYSDIMNQEFIVFKVNNRLFENS